MSVSDALLAAQPAFAGALVFVVALSPLEHLDADTSR